MTQVEIAKDLGVDQGTVSRDLCKKSTNVQKMHTQEESAKKNKVHRHTQRKIDRIAKADPELAKRVIAKEVQLAM